MLNEVIEAFLDPLEAIFIQVSVAKVNESSRSGLLLQKGISSLPKADLNISAQPASARLRRLATLGA